MMQSQWILQKIGSESYVRLTPEDQKVLQDGIAAYLTMMGFEDEECNEQENAELAKSLPPFSTEAWIRFFMFFRERQEIEALVQRAESTAIFVARGGEKITKQEKERILESFRKLRNCLQSREDYQSWCDRRYEDLLLALKYASGHSLNLSQSMAARLRI